MKFFDAISACLLQQLRPVLRTWTSDTHYCLVDVVPAVSIDVTVMVHGVMLLLT
jgi:hypothetical protein